MNNYDVVVLGGGAGGLFAAANLNCGKVAVIEKERKLGRKLLATGNGRCNLTNLDMQTKYYNFSARDFIGKIILKEPSQKLIEDFRKMGLLCRPDSEGRVYPYSNQAISVVDVLVSKCEKSGVEFITDTRINEISPKNGGFELVSDKGIFFCKKLILACGGKVQKNLGSDGSSYIFANQLGIACSSVFPSLGAVPVDDKDIAQAKGVRTSAKISVLGDGNILHTEVGELQINEKNISGICVFQLSRYVSEYYANQSQYRNIKIAVDFAPDISFDELVRYFGTKKSSEDVFEGFLNKKLGSYLIKKSGIKNFSAKDSERLAKIVKKCVFDPSGTIGENSAQVTAGGIELGEINENFRSRKYKNLYIIGEALNVDGMCGGYNLHFAFASGKICADDINSKRKNNDKNKRN